MYEFPGGKREKGETIYQTAKRELLEETGACKYEIIPISPYSMIEYENEKIIEKYGMLYYARIFEIQELPNMEMESIHLFNKIPRELRYPEIYNSLINKISKEVKE